jgi:hypothetical protein
MFEKYDVTKEKWIEYCDALVEKLKNSLPIMA